MINTREFSEIIRNIVREELAKQPDYKIGTIASADGKPTITFAGEDQPSGKQYSFLNSYHPTVGDRVLLVGIKNTYVVLGKIDQTESNAVYVVDEGENQNGRYIRYSDGTQVCYTPHENRVSLVYSSPALLAATWTFPAPFVEQPFTVGAIRTTGGATPGPDEILPVRFASSSNTSTAPRVSRVRGGTDFEAGDTVEVYLYAIGQWK